MTKAEYRQAAEDMIYLSSCVLNGQIPDCKRVDKMNLTALYRVANYHMMTAITAFALESADIKDEAFTQAKAKAVRKNALLEIEKETVTERLEAEGIWYLLLKGSVLKELYPAEWMRQMTDVDILFDAKCRKKVKEIMEMIGFTNTQYREGSVHDCYQKAPVCDFEMHHSLFDPLAFERQSRQISDIIEYYDNIQSKLLKANEKQYERKLSNEDFYIFMTVHEYKHYANGGSGVRALLDIYVYWKRLGNLLDFSYITKELQILGLTELEQKNRELAFCLFDGKPLTQAQSAMIEYMLFSGSNGTYENLLKNQINRLGGGKTGKFRYCLNRIFPSMVYIKLNYPFVYKYKILIPFLPVYRITKGLLFYRTHLKMEILKLNGLIK